VIVDRARTISTAGSEEDGRVTPHGGLSGRGPATTSTPSPWCGSRWVTLVGGRCDPAEIPRGCCGGDAREIDRRVLGRAGRVRASQDIRESGRAQRDQMRSPRPLPRSGTHAGRQERLHFGGVERLGEMMGRSRSRGAGEGPRTALRRRSLATSIMRSDPKRPRSSRATSRTVHPRKLQVEEGRSRARRGVPCPVRPARRERRAPCDPGA
jgi:hypothetical protein